MSNSLGDYLGDLTDELVSDYGKNSYISEFVCTSEKSYAYIVKAPNKDDSVVCKVKGISLNYENAQIINFESMKDLVLSDQKRCIDITKDDILRTGDSRLYTAQHKYTFKVNGNKRIKIGIDKIETRPFGFY